MCCEELGCVVGLGFCSTMWGFWGLFSNDKIHVVCPCCNYPTAAECQAIKWQTKYGADKIVLCGGDEWVMIGKDERHLGLTYILRQYVYLLLFPKGDRGPLKCAEECEKGDEMYGTAKNQWLDHSCMFSSTCPRAEGVPWLFWLAWFGVLVRKVCKCSSLQHSSYSCFLPPG